MWDQFFSVNCFVRKHKKKNRVFAWREKLGNNSAISIYFSRIYFSRIYFSRKNLNRQRFEWPKSARAAACCAMLSQTAMHGKWDATSRSIPAPGSILPRAGGYLSVRLVALWSYIMWMVYSINLIFFCFILEIQ